MESFRLFIVISWLVNLNLFNVLNFEMMIGIWSPIAIIMDSIRNNQQILGLLYFGKSKSIFHKRNKDNFFLRFREIFYVVQEGLVSAKLLAHAQNSLLRVINNDTYEEMSLVFNRLAPAVFTKNKVISVLLLFSKASQFFDDFAAGLYIFRGSIIR